MKEMQKQGRDQWKYLQMTEMMRTDAILAHNYATGTPNMSQSPHKISLCMLVPPGERREYSDT
ncbi:hypothetical protein KDA_36070 [Dictyobacter alpinus]|uniref:Uncharacterized protein n=1 Tax=Dictyobacter alpinus TaxID=2014873 RepID=A0A402B9P7_9CHLR|nr:hypothetical protein KDA_36070 [Dictyobacter alpinus]